MFRGKESSNRIEISWLVKDLLNFGVLGSLQLWGGGRWVGGVSGASGGMGGVTTCMFMHAHACKCMYRNCKWLPTWRHPCLSCLTCMYVHAHACLCAWDTPLHTHTWLHPHPPIHHPPGPPHQSNFNNTWTNQDISIPFKDLKCVKNSPPMDGCMIWWVGGWVGWLMGGIRSNH